MENKRDWYFNFRGPEEKDLDFSYEMFKEISELFKSKMPFFFSVSVSEQYTGESEPHYDLAAGTRIFPGYGFVCHYTTMTKSYIATCEGKSYEGEVKTHVSTSGLEKEENKKIIRIIFEKYCKAIEEFYPEWKTEYSPLENWD